MFNVSCIAFATELGLIKWVIKVKLLSFIVGKWWSRKTPAIAFMAEASPGPQEASRKKVRRGPCCKGRNIK